MAAVARSLPARAAPRPPIEATDREIDELVYQLYGLTAEEIKIVEEAGGS